MGEVYRARDPRLGREVAIKVLSGVFSDDPERIKRFEREARLVGMLNHPNILAIYDIGTHENQPYLVTELLEGETLRTRLDSGSIPPATVLDYTRQIVRGLSVAHAKGITHRDLKPENLFITNDDIVKILDFGLAKLDMRIDAVSGFTAGAFTQEGSVLGTVGYMAPEQVRGLVADARSDIFSLGAVVYEMLSGKRAFDAETKVETMAQIMRQDPPRLDAAPEVAEIV